MDLKKSDVPTGPSRTPAQHGPRVHFAMAYGGNGIAIGADLIRRRILRKAHPLMRFLSFERLAEA
jgi:hypothetical protein